MKQYFNDICSKSRKITLVEDENLITEDAEVAVKFNDFFKDAVSYLDISENTDLLNPVPDHIEDSIDRLLEKYKSHPSVVKIKEKVKPTQFDFKLVELEEADILISSLNPNKAFTF